MSGDETNQRGSYADAADSGEADPLALEESRLIERSCNGDIDAFGGLVALHQRKVFAMLVQIVRNEEDAWDIAQEGFVKAWRAIRTFKNESSFFTWLFRIMRNLAIDHLRKRNRRAEIQLDDQHPSGADFEFASVAVSPRTAAPDERAWQSEIGSRIDQALGELSHEHREVIVLRELHGLDYGEIAAISACSIGTVMSRLFYARKKLQKLLHDLYENL